MVVSGPYFFMGLPRARMYRTILARVTDSRCVSSPPGSSGRATSTKAVVLSTSNVTTSMDLRGISA